ncbi:hypothetical protein CY35_05G148100 [Sphagnum magellanicum]|nr:hypothetical protein CY35_05G148100 [Sphagnum magellanicum]
MLLYGPPGTGKTTAAKELGCWHKTAGVLKSGNCTDDGKCAGYVLLSNSVKSGHAVSNVMAFSKLENNSAAQYIRCSTDSIAGQLTYGEASEV